MQMKQKWFQQKGEHSMNLIWLYLGTHWFQTSFAYVPFSLPLPYQKVYSSPVLSRAVFWSYKDRANCRLRPKFFFSVELMTVF